MRGGRRIGRSLLSSPSLARLWVKLAGIAATLEILSDSTLPTDQSRKLSCPLVCEPPRLAALAAPDHYAGTQPAVTSNGQVVNDAGMAPSISSVIVPCGVAAQTFDRTAILPPLLNDEGIHITIRVGSAM
jgi:hypothetical protein